MEYLQGLKGSSREWANEDAVKRVIRYKEWEKKGGNADDEAEGKKESSSNPEEKEKVNDECKKFLNRLSDLLFVIARTVNKKNGFSDIIWKP